MCLPAIALDAFGIWAIFCCEPNTIRRHRHRHRHPYATGASFYEQKRRCWWCDTDTLQKVQAIALKASTGRTRVASNFNCNPMANRWQTAGQTAGQRDG